MTDKLTLPVIYTLGYKSTSESKAQKTLGLALMDWIMRVGGGATLIVRRPPRWVSWTDVETEKKWYQYTMRCSIFNNHGLPTAPLMGICEEGREATVV